jgi:NAD(P)-dependent dehydrogenase (short-subunit alcohol dehydrogenase family)
LGITYPLDVIELDVTNDSTILKTAEYMNEKYGKSESKIISLLHFPVLQNKTAKQKLIQRMVLINNAGIALLLLPKPTDRGLNLQDLRSSFNTTFNTNTNTASMFAVTTTFLPLLHLFPTPKVINISSSGASLTLALEGKLPPSASVSYSVSKVAVNRLIIEMQRAEDGGEGKIRFWAVNPGFCKTAFNGFRGTRDPIERAEVVVRLVLDEEGV